MKLELRDPGMHPLTLDVITFDDVVMNLRKYNTDFTTAFLSRDGVVFMNARRQVGDRTWNIRLTT